MGKTITIDKDTNEVTIETTSNITETDTQNVGVKVEELKKRKDYLLGQIDFFTEDRARYTGQIDTKIKTMEDEVDDIDDSLANIASKLK